MMPKPQFLTGIVVVAGLSVLWLLFSKVYSGRNLLWVAPEILFQNDLFMEESSCLSRTYSRLKAIHFNYRVPIEDVRSKMTLVAREGSSGFQQKIQFEVDHFFYPGLFGPQGHREFELPRCDEERRECDLGFFVFIPKSLEELPVTSWTIESPRGITESLRVKRESNDAAFFEDLRIKRVSREIAIFLDPARVVRLLREGYHLEVVFVYRGSTSQVGYSEEPHRLSLGHPWVKKGISWLKMSDPPQRTTYLAAMVIAQKGAVNHESKLVIQDDMNPRLICKSSM